MGRTSTEVLAARSTLTEEMAAADLGDARLNARRDRVIAALAHAPDAGFPAACGDEAASEALYRFLRNRRVSLARVLEPHLAATRERCQAIDDVLVLHDTTEVAFAGTQPRAGLTALSPRRHGFWIHTSLAVSADGLRAPLGLVAVAPFTRAAQSTRLRWRERFHDPQKESRRWATGVATVRARLTGVDRVVHVMDREGDSYEVLAAMATAGDRYIVRLHYDRAVTADGPTLAARLSAVRAQAVPLYTDTVTVAARRGEDRAQRLAYPAREGRIATVAVAAYPLTLQRPRDHRATPLPPGLPVHVIFAWEVDPPAGATPLEWWLVTSEPIATHDEVRRVIAGYRTRWLIEEFFKCLKTGCAYEQRQLESLDTLLVALACLAPIAWQLLLLRHLARHLPDTDATAVLTPQHVALLRQTRAGHQLPAMPSVQTTLRAVARLGGHLRQNGEPGWLVLMRGMQKLRDMEAGWNAAQRWAERSDQS